MSYRSPLIGLFESLFRNYPYMDLSQRLMVISALVRTLDPSALKDIDIAKVIMRARELELEMEILVNMYRRGEIGELQISEELGKLYEMENKLLAKLFSFFIKKHGEGVNKYL